MNVIDFEILKILLRSRYSTQKALSALSGYSVGKVNQSLAVLRDEGLLTLNNAPTRKAKMMKQDYSPRNAVILAAGIGLRQYPSNRMISKGLLKFKGEIIVERLIRQLHEVGITDITIIVGFMKESYDYLIDDYGVKLVVNTNYEKRNNLHSLNLVSDMIGNTYILPCDLWFEDNPFSDLELFSWYMVSDELTENSNLRVNRKRELVGTEFNESGNAVLGVAYIAVDVCESLVNRLHLMDKNRRYYGSFWDEALLEDNKMCVWARIQSVSDVIEINSFDQLRELEESGASFDFNYVSKALSVSVDDIENIYLLKAGTTNKSFHFSIGKSEYVIRIPSRTTLIDRNAEYEAYSFLKGLKLSDTVVFFDVNCGIKISRFIDNAHVLSEKDIDEKKQCINFLKRIHLLNIDTEHSLDIWKLLENYESLRSGESVYRDYVSTKEKIYSLRKYICGNESEYVLCHGEPIAENFLIDEAENIRLIDWENSGMQDPDVDLALMAVYSCYSDSEIESLIDVYHDEGCSRERRRKIYALVALCGLMSSNWCEYRARQGIEFGAYAMKQYRYAKDYYRKAIEVC